VSDGPEPRADASAGETRAATDRRQHVRHGVGAPTVVVLPGKQSEVRALIRDISKGGCLLDTDASIAVGTRLSLAFLSRRCGHCRAMGCVVRTTGKSGFGVAFSQVNIAFLGFVGSIGSDSPDARVDLVAAMKGSTVEIIAGSEGQCAGR
jgi:hypothetical protein